LPEPVGGHEAHRQARHDRGSDGPGSERAAGSQRAGIFGGDSLQGRYHLLRLHPLSAAELRLTSAAELNDLLTLGGFPEPYWGGSDVEARRWSRDYRTRLIREDVAGLERLHDLGHLELLMLRLPDLTGSPLSINAVREDLQVAHKTMANWLDILDRLYAIFRISPFGAAAHPGGEEGTEALPLGLDARLESGITLREPRGVASAQVGAFPAGH
jgi:hypothetical protein